MWPGAVRPALDRCGVSIAVCLWGSSGGFVCGDHPFVGKNGGFDRVLLWGSSAKEVPPVAAMSGVAMMSPSRRGLGHNAPIFGFLGDFRERAQGESVVFSTSNVWLGSNRREIEMLVLHVCRT